MLQENRLIKITTSLGENVLLGTQFYGSDAFSTSFHFFLDVLSSKKNISGKTLLQRPLSVEVFHMHEKPRYFHGILSEFESLQQEGDFFHYRLQLRPQLWFLTLTKNFRMFQQLSAPEIIKSLLQEYHIIDFEFSLSQTYKKRDYCCQYNESTYDFLHRLMEEEGIFYFYEHEKTKHKIIFSDNVKNFKKIIHDNKTDLIYKKEKIQTGKISVSDYSYYTPSARLYSEQKQASNVYETHYYPAQFDTIEEAEKKINFFQLANEIDASSRCGNTHDVTFSPGTIFQYSEQTYYLLSVNYFISDRSYFSHGSQEINISFSCASIETPYKSLRTIEKPRALGVETAFVVGSQGSDIFTDELGRVKVKFHWDRQNQSDGQCSCWIRSAQPWAGNYFGMQFLPRVGQEVVVQFVHGDPDQPIITGALFNPENKPPFTLPANKTKSGIKTQTIPRGGSLAGNELSFEDAQGKEEIFLHAQKDFKRQIEANEICEIKKGNLTARVSQGEIHFDAHKKITFTVGSALIEIEKEGISIVAKKVKVKK